MNGISLPGPRMFATNLTPANKTGWVVAALLAAALVGYSLVSSDDYTQHLLMWCALNAVIAVSLRFMLLVGETNIATGALYGMGAYVAGVFVTKLNLSFPLSLAAGGCFAAGMGVLFGLVTLRTKGPYFMLISFAFTEVIRLIYTRVDWLGGNSGMIGIFPPMFLDPWMPVLTLLLCGSLILFMYFVEASNLGRVFKAIENNDAIVETVGIDVTQVKLICLVISAFALGVAGANHAFVYNVISPGDFSYLVPVFALAYVKIGGDSHVGGSILGAFLLTALEQALQGSGALQHILFGGAIITSMLILPDGLWGGGKWVLRRIARLAT